MTAVADEEVLRAAELDLSVDDLVAMEPLVADTESHAGPVIRILKGAPTDDEIAALVCVLAAAAASTAGTSAPKGPADLWGRPTFMHRGTTPFSPYAFPYLSHLRD
ncbi:acyl-CoA carboxylase subunit epsilon [Nocardia sp. CDC159]|uniref:Acyl-CoA carboxylase subunit epsilon n=1 Tax=Nocardia pulmonis TaxID=2951408 RepID=A0A9X2J0G3_9NOCA|nr:MULTISPECIES: acyl-CoA carboxylase subunit epsilon [Nocardia]MCM6777789.1 acyl-CoA carboxylase subunit epsilon [Nocardia pulmonis]MCM6790674.1 acyl-CoA carboxylase subunit epsilon [Nocardia sp. CDC159]